MGARVSSKAWSRGSRHSTRVLGGDHSRRSCKGQPRAAGRGIPFPSLRYCQAERSLGRRVWTGLPNSEQSLFCLGPQPSFPSKLLSGTAGLAPQAPFQEPSIKMTRSFSRQENEACCASPAPPESPALASSARTRPSNSGSAGGGRGGWAALPSRITRLFEVYYVPGITGVTRPANRHAKCDTKVGHGCGKRERGRKT